MTDLIQIAMPPARLFASEQARQSQKAMDADLVARTEFNWIQAAREAERRIIANHYCPKMPARLRRPGGRPMVR